MRTLYDRTGFSMGAWLLVATLATWGCSPAPPASDVAIAPGDLLIVDADAGSALSDGERYGMLLVARSNGDGTFEPARVVATDERWREPVDALALADGSVLVLDQQFARDGAAARGAIFRVAPPDWQVVVWWTDERSRQPTCMARDTRGTIYVSDRSADPGRLGTITGCVFAIRAGRAPRTTIAAAGIELVTPGGLLATRDGRLLLMDADANPDGVASADGRRGTPGVLFEILDGHLATLLQPHETVSPVGLMEGPDGTIFLVDANAGTLPRMLGDGALFRIQAGELVRVLDTQTLGRPRALVDPAFGDSLPDGRLVVADANADPQNRGPDGTAKGVYGTGPGCVLVLDPVSRTAGVLLTDDRFVTPLAVRRVRP